MPKKDIIQELNDLGSSLGSSLGQVTYSVPEGYFNGLADQVLNLIKNEDVSWLSFLPKEMPYRVPVGYFDGLDARVLDVIHNHPDYQTPKEELESLSPLLSSIANRPVYAVPEGYFENFKVAAEQKKAEPKVISLISHRWFKYAAAAVIVVALGLTGLFVFKNNHSDPAGRTLAKLEKEVKTIDDVKKTDSLIEVMDAGLNPKELASTLPAAKVDDVQQLLQDVSTDELKDFNDQSKDIEEVMMTN
ncbi:MAG TPA: hypothetical protein VGI82_03765 [Chitinophagaceae bacterium]|jgi:hypothetical protein